MATISNQSRKGKRACGPKVRTGCITCKIRRVKCDEAKPFCNRCESTGRKCDGYVSAKTKNLSPSSESAALLVPGRQLFALPDSVKARRALDFFQSRTAPQLSGYFDTSFWSGLLLRLSQSEPAVRHAMIAVSSVHERFETSTEVQLVNPNIIQLESFALKEYNEAISCLKEQMNHGDQSVRLPLLACILFVCLEFLRQDVDTAMAHMHSGFRILNTWQNELSPSPSNSSNSPASASSASSSSSMSADDYFVEENLVPLFSRLTIVSALFGKRGPEVVQHHHPDYKTDSEKQLHFTSLERARTALFDFMSETMRFIFGNVETKYQAEIPMEVLLEQTRLQAILQAWEIALDEFMERNDGYLTSQEMTGAMVLRVQHKTVEVWLSQALSPTQSGFDERRADFEKILDMANEVLSMDSKERGKFTFEMGIIPTLYLVGIKCRDPLLRRRALSLLAIAPQKEGLWDAHRTAKVVKRVIDLEEAGMVTVPESTSLHIMYPHEYGAEPRLPDETSRIPDVDMTLDGDNSGAKGQLIRIRTKPNGPFGEWQTWEEFVRL